jgi:pimeloyl-ACP methyl ester carboxylesterase
MSMSEGLVLSRGTARLIAERWSGAGPVVVLLHAGVTDRRSWRAVAAALKGRATMVSYDRRGFGETAPSDGDFSHVEDLVAILDEVTDAPAWLVGSSAGGGIALDAAISAPELVAGLVLLAPAVSGAPAAELDVDTARFDRLVDEAIETGDLDEVNRLETWLWLDGPAQAEGRVGDPARSLTLDMNRIILANGVAEGVGASDVDAWSQLAGVDVRVTVACGDLDVPFLVDRSRELAERLADGRHRVLAGLAHLPQIEDPVAVAALVDEAITGA